MSFPFTRFTNNFKILYFRFGKNDLEKGQIFATYKQSINSIGNRMRKETKCLNQ